MSYKSKEWHTGDMFTPEDATEMSQAIEDNEVVINPELSGDEESATSIQVGKAKFKLAAEGESKKLSTTKPSLKGDYAYMWEQVITTSSYEPWVANGNVWTDGNNIYCSAQRYQYIFNKNKKLFEPIIWNIEIESNSDIWTDGVNVYYSHINNQYVLDKENLTWIEKTWTGEFTTFMGSSIWNDGEHIFLGNNYILNKDTLEFEPITITGAPVNFHTESVWTDGKNTYYSESRNEYQKVFNYNTLSWDDITWTGLTIFDGFRIWTDGEDIYYSEQNNQYKLVKDSNKWEEFQWSGDFIPASGSQIWYDGQDVMYYNYRKLVKVLPTTETYLKDDNASTSQDINYLEILSTLNYSKLPVKYLKTNYGNSYLDIENWANKHNPELLDILSDISVLPEVQSQEPIVYLDFLDFSIYDNTPPYPTCTYDFALRLDVSYHGGGSGSGSGYSSGSGSGSGQSGPVIDSMYLVIRKSTNDNWVELGASVIGNLYNVQIPGSYQAVISSSKDTDNIEFFIDNDTKYEEYKLGDVYTDLFGIEFPITPNVESTQTTPLSNIKIGDGVYNIPRYPSVITNDMWNTCYFQTINGDYLLELLMKLDYNYVVSNSNPDLYIGGFNIAACNYQYGGDTQFASYDHFVEVSVNSWPSCSVTLFGDNGNTQSWSGGNYNDYTLENIIPRINFGQSYGMEYVYPYGKPNETMFIYPYIRMNGKTHWLSWDELNYIFNND